MRIVHNPSWHCPLVCSWDSAKGTRWPETAPDQTCLPTPETIPRGLASGNSRPPKGPALRAVRNQKCRSRSIPPRIGPDRPSDITAVLPGLGWHMRLQSVVMMARTKRSLPESLRHIVDDPQTIFDHCNFLGGIGTVSLDVDK